MKWSLNLNVGLDSTHSPAFNPTRLFSTTTSFSQATYTAKKPKTYQKGKFSPSIVLKNTKNLKNKSTFYAMTRAIDNNGMGKLSNTLGIDIKVGKL